MAFAAVVVSAAGGIGIMSSDKAAGLIDTQIRSDEAADSYIRQAFVLHGTEIGHAAVHNAPAASSNASNSPSLAAPVEALPPISAAYVVQPGDTLTSVAIRFSISSLSIIWNNADKVINDQLTAGDQLNIPAVDGILYTLKQGETLSEVAAYYGIEASAIIAYAPNRLVSPDQVPEGATILLPGATPPLPPPPSPSLAPTTRQAVPAPSAPVVPYSASGFRWPFAGPITAYVGDGRGHTGLDISGTYGAGIVASAAGRVTFAGAIGDGYGNYVIISHGDGLTTLYAHMSEIYATTGQSVGAGTTIGAVGCSGLCTGPHVHFEIRVNGSATNPLNYLP